MGRTSNPRARKPSPVVAISRDTAKQQTREALLAAALELFGEQGLDGPSLDAICERAGYTRGAFYVHFPDRDALLVAAMEKVGEAFLASVFEQVQTHHLRGRASSSSVGLSDGVEPLEFHGIGPAAASSRNLVDEAGAAAELPSSRSVLAEATERFVAAIGAGAYPLMPPPRPRSPKAGPQVRPHQLIEACARSPVVRERYKALVEASIHLVADLTVADQAAGAIRAELDAQAIGTTMLALVLGAQTMAELGVAVDPALLARTMLRMMLAARPPTS